MTDLTNITKIITPTIDKCKIFIYNKFTENPRSDVSYRAARIYAVNKVWLIFTYRKGEFPEKS